MIEVKRLDEVRNTAVLASVSRQHLIRLTLSKLDD